MHACVCPSGVLSVKIFSDKELWHSDWTNSGFILRSLCGGSTIYIWDGVRTINVTLSCHFLPGCTSGVTLGTVIYTSGQGGHNFHLLARRSQEKEKRLVKPSPPWGLFWYSNLCLLMSILMLIIVDYDHLWWLTSQVRFKKKFKKLKAKN